MARAIDLTEDVIYAIVAVLLIAAGAFVLWSATTSIALDIQRGRDR